MKKPYLIILAALAVAAVALFFLFNNPLGRLVKLAVEEFGPRMTQADVRVGEVKISAGDGQGAISGLLLGNPKGFKTDYALKADKIEVGIEPASIAQDIVMIHKVLLDAPHIIYEKGDHGSNLDAIQRNVEQYLGVNGGKDSKSTDKKMIIDSLVISNAKVSYNGKLELTLPDIEMRNIGKNTGGANSAQVVKAVCDELVKQILLTIPKAAADSIGSAVKGLLGK